MSKREPRRRAEKVEQHSTVESLNASQTCRFIPDPSNGYLLRNAEPQIASRRIVVVNFRCEGCIAAKKALIKHSIILSADFYFVRTLIQK